MEDFWSILRNVITRSRDLSSIGFATGISTIIIGLFWFYVASLIGAKNYGEISYYIAAATMAGAIGLIGSGNTLIVYVSKEIRIQAPIYYLTLISGFAATIVYFVIFSNIGASVFVFGFVIFALVTSELLGQKFFIKYSKYLLTQKILHIFLAITLYYVLGPNGIILGIGLSYFPFLIKLYKVLKGSKFVFDTLKPRFGFMMNSYIFEMSKVFVFQVDKLVAFPMFGFTLLGNYQLAVQVLLVLILLPSTVFLYVLPHDAKGFANKKLKTLVVLFSGILTILVILFTPHILPLLYPEFVHAIELIQIISLATTPLTINIMYASKFLGNEKTRIVIGAAILFILVQIASIFILGNLYGIIGLAIAMVLAATAESVYFISVDRGIKNKIKKR